MAYQKKWAKWQEEHNEEGYQIIFTAKDKLLAELWLQFLLSKSDLNKIKKIEGDKIFMLIKKASHAEEHIAFWFVGTGNDELLLQEAWEKYQKDGDTTNLYRISDAQFKRLTTKKKKSTKKPGKVYYLVSTGIKEEGNSDEEYYYNHKLFSALNKALAYCAYYIAKHDKTAPMSRLIRLLSRYEDADFGDTDERRVKLETLDLQ